MSENSRAISQLRLRSAFRIEVQLRNSNFWIGFKLAPSRQGEAGPMKMNISARPRVQRKAVRICAAIC